MQLTTEMLCDILAVWILQIFPVSVLICMHVTLYFWLHNTKQAQRYRYSMTHHPENKEASNRAKEPTHGASLNAYWYSTYIIDLSH